MSTQELATRVTEEIATAHTWSLEQIVAQQDLIRKVMDEVMEEGKHYGKIPGIAKPTLLKPGAETLCVTFRFNPKPTEIEETRHPDDHYSVRVTTTLFHILSGNEIASGVGSCTTRESKYAYRHLARVCPNCGAAAIVKQKEEKGGNWICVGNDKGGCWSRFQKGDPAIESQETGRVANPDLADQYNTVLKMASKRSLIAATLNATAASDIFTQDVEDHVQSQTEPAANPQRASQPAAAAPSEGSRSGGSSPRTGPPSEAAVVALSALQTWVGQVKQKENRTKATAMKLALEAGVAYDGTLDAIPNLPDELIIELARKLDATDVTAPSGEVKAGPCPYCGTRCKPVTSSNDRAPKWRCGNESCDAGKDGKPWASWHVEPWKPGGEVDQITRSASGGGEDGAVGEGKSPEPERTESSEPPSGLTAGARS